MSPHDLFMFLINHAFLPPKLPQKDDSQQGFGNAFADYMLNAFQEFQNVLSEGRNEVGVLIDMLYIAKKVHDAETDDDI